jgi:hypothetical protein
VQTEPETSGSIPQTIDIDSDNKEQPRLNSSEQTDLEYSRETYLELIESNREAVELALNLARETESPSVLRVLGELLKSTSDVTDRLVELHKSNKELQQQNKSSNKQQQPNESSVVNNNMFVGSTDELQKFLKEMKNKDQ